MFPKGVHKKNATGILSVKRQESKNKLIQFLVPRRFEYRGVFISLSEAMNTDCK